MKKLRIILKSKFFLILLLFISLLSIIFFNLNLKTSILNINNNCYKCIVENIINNKKLELYCDEKIDAYIDDSNNIKIGDILEIKGNLTEYNSNTFFNQFNYKEYKKLNNTFYKLYINEYKKVGHSNNLILKIKNIINSRINKLSSYNYLKTLILGDKKEIDNKQLNIYKKVGIIHLFSVSGMHISLLLEIINYIYKKDNIKKDIFIIFILIFYYLLIHSVSLLRCIVFYIINKLNKYLFLNINKKREIAISIMILLIIKPGLIYNIGFYYSIIVSIGISLNSKKIFKSKNKFNRLLLLSTMAFLFSFPLNVYNYYEINFISIISNIIFVPLITLIVFPLSLITLFIPILDSLLKVTIDFIEELSLILCNINLTIILKKPDLFLIIIYYLLIYLLLKNKKTIYILLLLMCFHYNYNEIFKSTLVLFFDVGQGDSLLIHNDNINIMIDTGGNQNNYSNIENNIIPTIKSFGIKKIDIFIISHGDYDHMGEAINLVNNFKVAKVIFNCGPYNDLEQELIKDLDKKKIKYYSCIKELNIDKNKLYFFQTKEYDNENDNSNVIYTEMNGYKFMFMGDASSTTEHEILSKYNIPDIDVLKVGHHGSKTSSSIEFIDEINPKYSIISVGKNNRYGHPNKEVLDNLNDSKVYRTDQDGSIMLKIKNNKLKIETCSP